MTSEPASAKRTWEIEEATNRYIIHPLSRGLVTPLARWGVPPNAVSLAGMGLGAAAAVAYYHYAAWPLAVLGFALMIGWHVLDGADGQLARLTGRTSEMGKVLDGLCDHLTFALVYLSLALALTPLLGGWVWLAAALAGLSHLAQASAYEFRRQAYDFWVHGKGEAPAATLNEARQTLEGTRGLERSFARLHVHYLQMQRRLSAVDARLHARLHAALRKDKDRARAAYRSVNLKSVHHWSLLCSNYRTVALFVACLAGWPVYFFLFEIVILNAVFAWLVQAQRRRNAALRTRLQAWRTPTSEVGAVRAPEKTT